MRKKRRKAAVGKAIEALESELTRLRAVVHEIGEACVTNLEAEIIQIAGGVEEVREDLRDDGGITRMLEEIQALKVKPEKGRMKDLKKVDELIDRLEEILGQLE